jgi:hypothetical protein
MVMKAVLILFLIGLVSLSLGWQIVKVVGSIFLGAFGIIIGIIAAVTGLVLGLLGAFFGIGLLGILSPILLAAIIIAGLIILFSLL